MVIKSDFGIYRVLEELLKNSDKPLTCTDLFEHDAVRRFAPNANKVSDFLGHMWRRGLLNRFYAPKTSTSFARFAYSWKDEQEDETYKPIETPAKLLSRPNIEVTQDGESVIMDFGKFTVTIAPKV